jgi:hypothetical protein
MPLDEDHAPDASQTDSGKPDANQDKGGEKAREKTGDKAGENASGKDEKDGGKAASPRSKTPLIITAVVVLVLVIIGFFIWFAHRNQVSTDDAYTDGNTVTMMPKVSGYVVDLYVSDNTHVRKGDLLLRIDARDFLTAVAQARAQLALAEAQLNSARDALQVARVQYPARSSKRPRRSSNSRGRPTSGSIKSIDVPPPRRALIPPPISSKALRRASRLRGHKWPLRNWCPNKCRWPLVPSRSVTLLYRARGPNWTRQP